jgi:deoxyribodipyrimidine photo-lyase
MNYNGCKRKFDIKKYCAHVDKIVREAKARAAAAGGAAGGSGAAAGKKK